MVSEVYLHTIPLNWITSYITNKNFKLKMPQSKFLIFLSKLSLSIAFSKSLHNIFISSVALVAQKVKNLPAMQETGVWSLEKEDPPGEGNGDPLQYSCLENPMDEGAWQATVNGVTKNQTQLSD